MLGEGKSIKDAQHLLCLFPVYFDNGQVRIGFGVPEEKKTASMQPPLQVTAPVKLMSSPLTVDLNLECVCIYHTTL